jgi:hypothetical protein
MDRIKQFLKRKVSSKLGLLRGLVKIKIGPTASLLTLTTLQAVTSLLSNYEGETQTLLVIMAEHNH